MLAATLLPLRFRWMRDEKLHFMSCCKRSGKRILLKKTFHFPLETFSNPSSNSRCECKAISAFRILKEKSKEKFHLIAFMMTGVASTPLLIACCTLTELFGQRPHLVVFPIQETRTLALKRNYVTFTNTKLFIPNIISLNKKIGARVERVREGGGWRGSLHRGEQKIQWKKI